MAHDYDLVRQVIIFSILHKMIQPLVHAQCEVVISMLLFHSSSIIAYCISHVLMGFVSSYVAIFGTVLEILSI